MAKKHHHLAQTVWSIFQDLPKLEEDDESVEGSNFERSFSIRNSDYSSTIYKTIDIEKTEAFNRTRRDIETQRQLVDAHTKWRQPQKACLKISSHPLTALRDFDPTVAYLQVYGHKLGVLYTYTNLNKTT